MGNLVVDWKKRRKRSVLGMDLGFGETPFGGVWVWVCIGLY